ncbi:MAG: GPW/gp25 family protein, partial [Acidobacteriota bacterium]
IILGTAPGERINRPRFGCQIHDLMFAPNNPSTSARAEIYCEEAIYKFEPRIEKVSCRAAANRDEPNRLDIRIEYVIAGKNEKRNLVFPFYLKHQDEEPEPLDQQEGV